MYHAANKNVEHVVVVSHDTDFACALKRVEDFGVATTIAPFLVEPTSRLRANADQIVKISKEVLMNNRWAVAGTNKSVE
ncbi:hypothetical protein [Synoicihabitans lomoniglobus]|uniref:hypothetical protein n=1 Tax=Synoicihabitans lomoniglobus TaxID=2909285 RepID=UPI003CE5C5FD